MTFVGMITLCLAIASHALELCSLVMNDTSASYSIQSFDLDTGLLTLIAPLPSLAHSGYGPSAGAQFGTYFTASDDVETETLVFIADMVTKKSSYVKMIMPSQFANLTRYGVASLNLDEGSQKVIVMIVGIDAQSEWYCFLGMLNEKSGVVEKVLADLSEEIRTWAYLYDGITAWDPDTGLYYLQAVIGSHDRTTILAYNISRPGRQIPVVKITYPYKAEGDGMFYSLAISPALRSRNLGGLVALVDALQDSVAIWTTDPRRHILSSPLPASRSVHPVVRIPRGQRHPRKFSTGEHDASIALHAAPAPWKEIIQFDPFTLEVAGPNNMILDDKGTYAYATFNDMHRPVANEVVVQVNLLTGEELTRTSVVGSQIGTSIDFLVQCPSKL